MSLPPDLAKARDASAPFVRLFQRDSPWVIMILLLNLVFFSDALFTDKTFFVRDVSFFHYPLKKLVTEAYARGEWPLWNPYIQLGQPLLANPNSMALYPTQILFQFLPFEIAFDLHFVLHCALAGAATYYLARTIGLSHLSAFLSAGIYNFSGVTLSFVNLFNVLPVVAHLPLLSLGLIKTLRSFSLIKMASTSFLFAIFFLLLEPLSSVAAGFFVIPLVAAVFLMTPSPRISLPRALIIALIAVVSGLLLASIQIIPTSELVQYSGRKSGLSLEVVSFWSMHPVGLLQLVAPRLFGEYFRLSEPTPWGSFFFDGREPYLLSCYIGFFSLLLVIVGLLISKQRWLAKVLMAICIVSIILALGKYTPVFPWLFDHVPVFRYGRYPVKYMYVVNLCLSLLAGFGFERIGWLRDELNLRSKPIRTVSYILALLVLLFLVLLSGLSSEFGWDKLLRGEHRGSHLKIEYHGQTLSIERSVLSDSLKQVRVHLGGFVLFLLLVRWKKVRLTIIQASIVSLILFDLFISNLWINPLIPSDFYEPAPAALYLNEVTQTTGPYRIYRFDEERWQEHPSILGQSDSVAWVAIFRKLTLFQFLSAKDHTQYSVFNPIDRLETLPSQSISYRLVSAGSVEERLELLERLNVGYVLSLEGITSQRLSLEALFEINSDRPLRIYRLIHRLPRAVLIPRAETRRLSFDQQVRLRGESETRITSETSTTLTGQRHNANDRIEIVQYGPNHVEIEVNAIRDGLLVLLDSYYPGWGATIDGKKTPITVIDSAFRGVECPAGRHQVHFSYEPRTFSYGLYASSFTGVAWATALTLHCLNKRRGETSLHVPVP